jgi:hypothetical protein
MPFDSLTQGWRREVNEALKTKVGMPAIIIAVVVLVAFMSWWGYRSFNEGDKPKTARSTEIDAMLTAEAQKCQGDFSKLPPEDQAKVNKVTGGWGFAAIKKMYKPQ